MSYPSSMWCRVELLGQGHPRELQKIHSWKTDTKESKPRYKMSRGHTFANPLMERKANRKTACVTLYYYPTHQVAQVPNGWPMGRLIDRPANPLIDRLSNLPLAR